MWSGVDPESAHYVTTRKTRFTRRAAQVLTYIVITRVLFIHADTYAAHLARCLDRGRWLGSPGRMLWVRFPLGGRLPPGLRTACPARPPGGAWFPLRARDRTPPRRRVRAQGARGLREPVRSRGPRCREGTRLRAAAQVQAH